MRTERRHFLCSGAIVLALGSAAALASMSAMAQSPEEFYRGKTIDLYIGFSAGGGYDTYARVLAEHLSRHVPGNPTIIPRQMTGGGSRVAAAYMANVAPRDGTAIATTDQSLPLFQALRDPSILFDTTAFHYIGNPIADNNLVVTWHTSPVRTVEDARQTQVAIGASGPDTSAFYPTAMNEILGTRFELIMGYSGGADVNLAMQQGEVDGRGSNSWSSYKATTSFVENDELNYLVQVGLERAQDLPDIPLLLDYGETEADFEALRLLSAPTAIGRPFYAPPGTPEDRVEALRRAFDATMEDPRFIEAAANANLELNPVSGEEVQRIVQEMVDAPPAAVDRLSEALGPLLSQ